jgi:hypothetical protein
MTIAVAGRTLRSYARPTPFTHSVTADAPSGASGFGRRAPGGPAQMSRPPNGGGGLDYMKDGSPPWGGLGGYPFTPRERALGVRGGTNPSCMRRVYRPRRVKP